jgi:hypothetical protein
VRLRTRRILTDVCSSSSVAEAEAPADVVRSPLANLSRANLIEILAKSLLFLGFAYTKISSPWDKHLFAVGDGRIWAGIAEGALLTREFWFAIRPFTLALVFKAFAGSDLAVGWFQCVLAIISWGLFAATVSRYLYRPTLSVALFALILGIGLTSAVHGWDLMHRSESVSGSLLVLFFAASLRLWALPATAKLWRRASWLALAFTAALLAAFARDANSYSLLIATIFTPPCVWATGKLRSPRVLSAETVTILCMCAGLTGIAFTAQANTRASQRYVFPLMNTLFKRVLPNQEKLAYFRDELGMPVSRALMRRKGKFASADRRAAFNAPELEEFRTWVLSRGYSAYQKYLIHHPKQTLVEAYEQIPPLLRADFRRAARPSDNALTTLADEWLVGGPCSTYPYGVSLISALVALLVVRSRRHNSRVLAVFILFCLAAASSEAYITFHGDAMETIRHGVMVGVLVRLSAIMALVLFAHTFVDAAATGGIRAFRQFASRK